ncbi:peptidylprolyl isomerase [Denitratimonas tolerans]|uniref:peptidylprolyl isomerase n=1 Tax=Denitratimonas tolerans TaxID=1338420 RepID=A0AAW9R4L8_9GAMM|nr:peptidylprolyl isomerase [Chiayiivirga sp.]
MSLLRPTALLLACALPCLAIAAPSAPAATLAEVLAASSAADWRRPDPENTLYMDLPGGRVVIELAPQFAPEHVANIRTLAHARYWDGLAIVRVQDNYVAQWGDPEAGNPEHRRAPGEARARLPAEFERDAADSGFRRIDSRDAYAPQVGFVDGFAAARDPARGKVWMAHCYGLVGAGRDNPADSSNGAELYAVIGHAPRHLDRNITPVGRVLSGIEHLSSLPRGPAPMGFYTDPAQRTPIRSLRLASDLPESERLSIEVFRTDTPAFERLVQARRVRHEEWFIDPVGRIELCNVPVPIRLAL